MHFDFPDDYRPIPRRGMTSIEAVEFLKKQLPDVPNWTLWRTRHHDYQDGLEKIVGDDNQTSGTVGDWNWERVASAYPSISYWDGKIHKPKERDGWVGLLKVTGPQGENFFLFSYLDSMGCVGSNYCASTSDMAMLARFACAVREHFKIPKETIIRIRVQGGEDIEIDGGDNDKIFMPDALRQDIESQAFAFFEGAELYKQLGLRHRRGFLFVGTPGTGKTIFLHHLIRQCYLRYKTTVSMLNICQDTDEYQVQDLFRRAAACGNSLIVLEDLDSLTREARVSRSNLLSQLDGLGSRPGVLVIGTTNNPQDIDPALIHRPSRFDRVWRFELPSYELRLAYLQWAFPSLDASLLDEVADATDDWSFAYLNELRTTAAIQCVGRKETTVTAQEVRAALQMLSIQFEAGRKNHTETTTTKAVGFGATRKHRRVESPTA